MTTDLGNADPPHGIDNRRVRCLKCGQMFELKERHVCMRPLPTEFNRNGYTFTQVQRVGNVAIFDQRKPGAQVPYAFEVIVVRQGRPHPKDADQTDKEHYPSSEEWGSRGWTYMTLREARKKAAEVGCVEVEK